MRYALDHILQKLNPESRDFARSFFMCFVYVLHIVGLTAYLMNLQDRPRNPHFTNGESESQRIKGNLSKVTCLESEGSRFC